MHAKRSVFYYLLVLSFLIFAFFTNDFNLVNVQKTAIITAIAIDREDENFTLTAAVANPALQAGSSQNSQGGGSENGGYVTIEGKGGTVAEALENINSKTGWYPKLVFCRLLILGEKLCKENVFDALDYFLRSEYAADDCLIAAADGDAKELISAKTPTKGIVSEAIEKVLSDQPKQVGAVLTNSLRPFAVSYFSAGGSSYAPILKKESGDGGDTFSAEETALFVGGKRIGKLTSEQTFALACVKNPLRLASYTVTDRQTPTTLVLKRNVRRLRLVFDEEMPVMRVALTMYANLTDTAKGENTDNLSGREGTNAPFSAAAEQLKTQLEQTFSACKAIGFDAFDAIGRLQKYENNRYPQLKDALIERLQLALDVRFVPIR